MYVVRRNLETFLGPMNIEELKRAQNAMEFGLHDEIAGNCGEWVRFDKPGEMGLHYPEVIDAISKEMFESWGISTHPKKLNKTKINHSVRKYTW